MGGIVGILAIDALHANLILLEVFILHLFHSLLEGRQGLLLRLRRIALRVLRQLLLSVPRVASWQLLQGTSCLDLVRVVIVFLRDRDLVLIARCLTPFKTTTCLADQVSYPLLIPLTSLTE